MAVARIVVLVLVLAGCVDGTPYAPCPNVVVYMSVSDSVLVTDSINHRPEC